jgi:predicted dehydrogenase
LKRGVPKLRDPLNFTDWQSCAEQQVEYSPDRFLNWRFYSMYGGGPVTDLGVQTLDKLDILAGPSFPVTVAGSGVPSTEPGFDTLARGSFSISYAGELKLAMSVNGQASSAEEFLRLEGPAGRMELTGAGASLWRRGASSPTRIAMPPEESEIATRRNLAAFFESVRTRKHTQADLADCLPATLACQMANLSAQSGTPANWNAKRREVS